MRKFFVASLAVLLMQFHSPSAFAANLIASDQPFFSNHDSVAERFRPVSLEGIDGAQGICHAAGQLERQVAVANHRSRKYDNAPMPYAVFFNGGYAVHATFDLKRLGRPASHGCIRLHPENAAEFSRSPANMA
jgi:hypothetical protein